MIASEAIQLGSGRRSGGKTIVRDFLLFFLLSLLCIITYALRYDFFSFRGLVSILIFLFFLQFLSFRVLFLYFQCQRRREEKRIPACIHDHNHVKTKHKTQDKIRCGRLLQSARMHRCILYTYVGLPTFFLPLFIPFFSIPTRKVAIAVFSTYLRHTTRGILEICVLYWQWGRRGM
jgi:hypothetical protein